MTADRPNTVRSPVFLEGQLQVLSKADSCLAGAHSDFHDVEVGGRTQLLGEGKVESPSVRTQFSLGTEEVVVQGSPLVENNLEELYRCFLEEVGEKRGPFS